VKELYMQWEQLFWSGQTTDDFITWYAFQVDDAYERVRGDQEDRWLRSHGL
jgi:hypothetical protein